MATVTSTNKGFHEHKTLDGSALTTNQVVFIVYAFEIWGLINDNFDEASFTYIFSTSPVAVYEINKEATQDVTKNKYTT